MMRMITVTMMKDDVDSDDDDDDDNEDDSIDGRIEGVGSEDIARTIIALKTHT